MTEAAVRFIIGGTLVAALPVIAKRLGPDFAGLALLFPAVSFAGLLFVGRSQGMAQVAATALSAVLLLPTVIAFLFAVHVAARRNTSLALTLSIGVVSWFIVALPLVVWNRRRAS
jgi:uncharacterized membrane protein (GlpM family)